MPHTPPLDRLHDADRRGFASDNYAGVHPEVLEALATANGGHVGSYGADPYTEALQDVVRGHFGENASCWPTFNGTGANVVALSAMTDRWDSVICSSHAHIHTDECGAPEKVAGIKIVDVESPDGRLTPERIDREAYGFGFEHHAQPRVVSVTQSTEVGTLYTPDQLRAVCEHAHALGMFVHLDGARIANAAAALSCYVDDELVGEGTAANLPGGLHHGLATALTLLSTRGHAVPAGTIFATGALTGIHPVGPGQHCRVEVAGGPTLRLRAVDRPSR